MHKSDTFATPVVYRCARLQKSLYALTRWGCECGNHGNVCTDIQVSCLADLQQLLPQDALARHNGLYLCMNSMNNSADSKWP